jgi:heavy metal translocating P-type ATPase
MKGPVTIPLPPRHEPLPRQSRRHAIIATLTAACIAGYLLARFALHVDPPQAAWFLWAALILGGGPLVVELMIKLVRRQFGSDLLAGISIVTAILLQEYLAGAIVVLMLSGGEALEAFAVRRASSVLQALAKRMPTVAHRRTESAMVDVPLKDVAPDDVLVVLPHEACPVDGVVIEGHGSMDEAYLTGEPYRVSKSVGSEVLAGAINGAAALTIRALHPAADSRYARIMQVMQQSQQQRPQMRRLGDQLGAIYTPLAVAIALGAWLISGEAIRFLAVLVVATPCPLLIAIPVTIIGSISLAARRDIIIRDPAILEQISRCRTIMFDKTGTLTYGEPRLVEQVLAPDARQQPVLQWAASLEQYSKHPLATPIITAATEAQLPLLIAEQVREDPGEGLNGIIDSRNITITGRQRLLAEQPQLAALLPSSGGALECVVLIDGTYAATYRFRDEPRAEGAAFIRHLAPMHAFEKVLLISGDRESEVKYLADRIGISEIHASQSPEQKLALVRAETARTRTVYAGDGINDAPAMLAATVGIAMGSRSDVTVEAAGAVVMDNMLGKIDELLHIGHRMRRIALQSAVGGMALSVLGMGFAAAGMLAPVAGALVQELIDVAAVLNALRAAWRPRSLTDF